MMKKIYALFSFFTLLVVADVSGQALYINNSQTGFRFNPGLGTSGTPKIVFDDVNILSSTIGDADSIGFTKIKVGIRRLASAPAVTVNVYLTSLDGTSFGLDSLPFIPPTLIGTFNLPANGATSQTQILSVGDSINVFKALAKDTGNLFTGFQTAFVGVSFSAVDANSTNGWRLTSGPDGNFDGLWQYDVDDAVNPRAALVLTGAVSTFYIEAYGRPVYAPIANDVRVSDITTPSNISCLTGPQTVTVQIQNLGDNTVAPGGAAVTLKVGGANTYSRTINNTTSLAKNAYETITFNDVDLSLPGLNIDTAIVNLGPDTRRTNDTLLTFSITATNISTFPAVEDAEGIFPVVSYVSVLNGDQLWALQNDTAYINPDMVDSLHAYGGTGFFFFDSYRSPNSTGFSTRLFSNCITLPAVPGGGSCTNTLSFYMSHDTTFLTLGLDDSLFVSVSTDKGQTWTRLGTGFGRLDGEFGTPGWRQENIDISAYAGQTIQIGFEGESGWGNIIGLDDITVTSNCVVPVSLVNFTAQKAGKNNKLNWKTSQEVNTLKFVIEQSANGREFTTLGEVMAAGNSNTEKTYSFTHNMPAKGMNYYRLKMVDIDNQFKYSPVRNLQNLGNSEITSYPNPVKDNMILAVNAERSGTANMIITDISGKVLVNKVYNVAEGDNNFTISTNSMVAGNYILKVYMNENVVVKKFTKL